jgi:D-xylose transport system permease protein
VNIPSFIVTLGGLQAWRGVILKLTKGATIPVEHPFFRSLGRDFLDRRIGIALAALSIARDRLDQHSPQSGATTSRAKNSERFGDHHSDCYPSIVIVAFIILMNQAGGVPIPVIFLLAVALAGAFLTANTTFGRYLYAIGGNPGRGAAVGNQSEAIHPGGVLSDGRTRGTRLNPAHSAGRQRFTRMPAR